MKIKDFRALVAQLGVLTTMQRDTLVMALSSNGFSDDALRLIETSFAKKPIRGRCGLGRARQLCCLRLHQHEDRAAPT